MIDKANLDKLYGEGCDAANTQIDNKGMGFITAPGLSGKEFVTFWQGVRDTMTERADEVKQINRSFA